MGVTASVNQCLRQTRDPLMSCPGSLRLAQCILGEAPGPVTQLKIGSIEKEWINIRNFLLLVDLSMALKSI